MNTGNEKQKNKNRSYFMYDFVKATAAIPVALWLRPRILYESADAKKRIQGGALVIANHIGFADPIALMAAIWYRRHHFICMKEFEDKWNTKIFFSWFHCLPIDRENFDIDSFRQITEHLEDGKLVCMFPEGRINASDGDFAPFKAGMVLMALKSKSPIVPVYISPQKRWYNRATMVIGESVRVDCADGKLPSFDDISKASERLREKEARLKELCKQ